MRHVADVNYNRLKNTNLRASDVVQPKLVLRALITKTFIKA